MRTIYLDHAATTPCREDVWEAMRESSLHDYGNPNSINSFGRRARQVVEDARERIAGCLVCEPREIVFTSGATESNNLAIMGSLLASCTGHLIMTEIEHDSLLGPAYWLRDRGCDLTLLPVDPFGRVTADQVLQALRPDTVLISVGHANNEIGTIQPLAAIASAVKSVRPDVLIHSDCVQTIGQLPIDFLRLRVDMASFTSQKFYGPKGIGGLFVRRGTRLTPQIVASEQKKLRPGTETVPLAVGMAAALGIACSKLEREIAYWTPVRDRLIQTLLEIEGSRLNGHATSRLPTNVNVSFAGVQGEDLVLRLDRVGILASTGSACTTGSVDPSHVLLAMGLSRQVALGALRLTMGDACRDLDLDHVSACIVEAVGTLRSTSYRRFDRARPSEVSAPEPSVAFA